MRIDGSLYEALSELIDYPEPDLVPTAERCRRRLPDGHVAAAGLEQFAAAIAGLGGDAREELYARTFDFHPPHCLDLGYQLFGEGYNRGVFLAKVKRAAVEHRVDSDVQLADHLTVVLRLLTRLPTAEARALLDEVAVPVLAKVLGTFGDEVNPYRPLLEAVQATLRADFAIETIRPLPTARPVALPGQTLGPPLKANRHEEGL